MADLLARLSRTLDGHGLLFRGGFYPGPRDRVPGETGTLVLVGNAGPDLWRVFAHHRRDELHPLDAWTRRVLTGVGRRFDARIMFPFGGPPYHPFQRWARRAEAVFQSPTDPLVHLEHGLWHAYRGARWCFRKRSPCHPSGGPPTHAGLASIASALPCVRSRLSVMKVMMCQPAFLTSPLVPVAAAWITAAARAEPVR
jgi:hypothetical protein